MTFVFILLSSSLTTTRSPRASLSVSSSKTRHAIVYFLCFLAKKKSKVIAMGPVIVAELRRPFTHSNVIDIDIL